MSEKFIITGQRPLNGTVEISGAKNNAGPILAATLLTKEPCIIGNLPLVEDVLNMIEFLGQMGVSVEWLEEKKIRIQAGENFTAEKMDPALAGKMRLSVLLIGPLLPRFKEFQLPPPGGDRIIGMVRVRGGGRVGLRPITTHLEAVEKLGAKSERKNNLYYFDGHGLRAGEVVLKEFSVTATENLMMAAAGIEGRTVIKGAAAEPHVKDLGEFLKKMGAKVEWVDSHSVMIEGQKELKGAEHEVIPEHLEVGTFFAAGAITPGILEIKGVIWDHLDMFLARMEEAGANFKKQGDSLLVDYSSDLMGIRIQALPWPGFPTDLLPMMIPLLTQAEGRSVIHDPLYENRLDFLRELGKMGADIEVVDPHRAFIFGKTALTGTNISTWDIRAGASLLVAALAAKGESSLDNIVQIDRGYERIDEKFKKLGAEIKRVND